MALEMVLMMKTPLVIGQNYFSSLQMTSTLLLMISGMKILMLGHLENKVRMAEIILKM
jgi:hypothetical protein